MIPRAGVMAAVLAALVAGCAPTIEVHWHRLPEVELPEGATIAWTARQSVPDALAAPALDTAAATATGARHAAVPVGAPPPCASDVIVVLERAVALHLGDVRQVDTLWSTWTCPGPTRVDTVPLAYELPDGVGSEGRLATAVGAVAADRLIEERGSAVRRLYTGVHPLLAAGTRSARFADWSGAVAAWRQVDAARSRRARGRAAYDIAVAAEISGRHLEARQWARDAVSLLDVPRTRRYLAVLEPEDDEDAGGADAR